MELIQWDTILQITTILENYNQNGTVETRFGSKTELEALITKAHAENMQVYADIVLNHNSGGQSQANPFTGTNTWTDFSGVASGKFQRSYHDFYKTLMVIMMKELSVVFRISVMQILMYKAGFGEEKIL